jgi:hypothetical protein
VKLLNIIRSVKVRSVSGTKDDMDQLDQYIASMQEYLKKLIDEFQARDKDVSEEQRKHESMMKADIEKVAKDSSQSAPPPKNELWEQICVLESARDLLELDKKALETNFENRFLTGLDEASNILIKQLQRILG